MESSSDIPIQIAEIIQTSHIRHQPSAQHDINPSTAADAREPAELRLEKDGDNDNDNDNDDVIPVSVLRPARRFSNLPPIPDLRFEQSYLHSIQDAQSWWAVAWVTIRDQLMMPLLQGVVYNLAWCGWHHWNRAAQTGGTSVGLRVRAWWYRVNNWHFPMSQRTLNDKSWSSKATATNNLASKLPAPF